MVRKKKGGIKDTPKGVHRTTVMSVKKMRPVAERIIKCIQSRGISEYKLSQMTGISASAINGWSNRGKEPNTDNVLKVSQALNVPYSYFTGVDLIPEEDKDMEGDAPKVEKIDDEEKQEELQELKELSYELLEENRAQFAIAFMKFLSGEKVYDFEDIFRMFMVKANGASHGKG